MDYQHPHLTVSEPATGHYVIENLQHCTGKDAEGRTVCAPSSCYISPMVPSDLLAAIIADRNQGTTATEAHGIGRELLEHTEDSAVVQDWDIQAGNTPEPQSASETIAGEIAAIVAYLTEHGTTRLNDLSEATGINKEFIKEVSGQGFHIAAAGWVKLGTKEGEA